MNTEELIENQEEVMTTPKLLFKLETQLDGRKQRKIIDKEKSARNQYKKAERAVEEAEEGSAVLYQMDENSEWQIIHEIAFEDTDEDF